jgi:glycosyltransferase involved in cell wall biosynthesis
MSAQLATRLEAPALGAGLQPVIGPPSASPVAAERRVLVAVRWQVGGIRTHVLYNYPAAALQGYRFTFVGPDDETFAAFAASMGCLPDSEFVGVEVRGPRCRMWPRLRRLLKSGRFTFLHSHGLTAACHGALAAVGTGVPHLTTVHDVLRPEQFVGWRGTAKRWAMGRLLRRVDDFVLPGHDVHGNLLEYLPVLGHGPCRLHVIRNGIDAAHYASPPAAGQELRKRLGLGPDTMLIGFLGRFMEQKGFLPLLGALERLIAPGPPAPFHLVAFGSGDYAREYGRQVERRGLRPFVTMLEAVADVQPLLGQLDLLVMPSLWEALPLLPMEAMAAGVPVLGTDCLGLREVLEDTPSHVVRAGDVSALAAALRGAITTPWIGQARAFAPSARMRFDNAPSARRLLRLFEQTAARRRA